MADPDSRAAIWDGAAEIGAWPGAKLLLRLLQLGLAFPSLLYVLTLAVFLFRPPELYLYYADRIAFVALVFMVGLRAMLLRQSLPVVTGITVPMMGLTALALLRALHETSDPQTWSLVASRFVVPFVLFHLAILIFRSPQSRIHFHVFTKVVLVYLVFTSIASLLDARALIFPRFILDESLGVHADRARGPMLQAVANGVSLTMLGLLVAAFPHRRRAPVVLLWIFLPVAVLATMTRAVWASFIAAAVGMSFRLRTGRCFRFAVAGVLIALAVGFGSHALGVSIRDRVQERGPIEARLAVYEAASSMFEERPFSGWQGNGVYAELARRMPGYDLPAYYAHNTYLSLAIEFGVPGLLLYAILFFNLFRLSRQGDSSGRQPDCGELRKVWPMLLGVYLFNGLFVDMVYQFVNGLLFTVAGILCAPVESEA